MKTTVSTVLDKYRGVAHRSCDACITLGVETTTTGMLWWKKVSYRDVWCICSTYIRHEYMDSSYFWTVVRYFPYDDKEAALKFLNELKEK